MKDIARRTGLGLATISSYFNGGNVREKNRIKIEEAIEELHYEVNEVARGLKTNATRTIGVVIPELNNTFCAEIITGMEDVLRSHGYATIVCDCRTDKKLEREAVEFLTRRRVDGIINMPVDEEGNHLKRFQKTGKPIVLIDRKIQGINCDSVLVDNKKAAEDAVRYFIERGHRNIGIIGGPEEVFTAQERMAGYYKALESAVYIGDEWDITSRLSINAGIRYSMLNALGPRTYYTYQEGILPSMSSVADSITAGNGKVIKTYHGPEFRVSARYAFTDDFSVKAGFNTMRQYIHKVSNTAVMSPTDTWKLSDPNIKPQRGWQVAAGAYYNTPGQLLELSVEGYYKKLIDYLDYRSSAQILMNHHLETDVINTEGYAYGVEFQVKKQVGKLNGWMSYTYSRTFLRQNDPRIARPINGGEWYPTEYDKPHDFKLVGNYKFTRRYSMSFNMDYSTGRPTTIPAGQYYDQGLKKMQVYYTDRNSYRVPDYFRMDLSFNIEPSHHLTLLTHSSLSFGIYNLTGRKNVYSVYFVSEEGRIQGYKMSIFGAPIPFVTYNIKF